SDFAAHDLRIAPYFLWHYHFARNCEDDIQLGDLFAEQKPLLPEGHAGDLSSLLSSIKSYNEESRADVVRFLKGTSLKVSKINHRASVALPLDVICEAIRELELAHNDKS
ncbi:MAG: hypothetical protein NXI02_32390, partial [Rhodobacteraceae bacterium]|nr:hypothetical protein [Paracoccaceae bacterium]